MTFSTSILLVTWGTILLLALAMAGLVRQVRFLTSALRERGSAALSPPGAESVNIGDPAPALRDLATETGAETVLLFASGDCGGCTERLAELEQMAGEDGPALVAVYAGSGNGFRSPVVRKIENRYDLFTELGISMTPFGMRVGKDGTVADARPLGSTEAVRQLLASGAEGGPR
jgi:hypothetical protein